MIKFNNLSKDKPYKIFKELYEESLKANQRNIEAICIASYATKNKEVNARFVNLKFINNKEFIFFSNYNSPKSRDFNSHDQITALIYWNSINVQIRMKAKIYKTDSNFNQEYFTNRDQKKNALAISSDQSMEISSYKDVQERYNQTLNKEDLMKCPNYWGGFAFLPFYFEFWTGHESRINKREVFDKIDGVWKHSFIQP